jgi:putative photosynthetic complex assembly protein 2
VTSLAVAIGFAVFVWWFSTGLVLLLNRLSRGGLRLALGLSTAIGLAALWALSHTATRSDLASVYCAFSSALLVWGWHELTFLTGALTGPRRTALPAGLAGWPRFVQSVRAILWHELGILGVGLLIVALTWGEANQVGTGTYLVLWILRTSAKLNLYFGVRNLSEAFLPAHLSYLESFFRRRPMNAFFPLSVGLSGLTLAWLVDATIAASSPAHAVGLTLVATMLALAIVEHLMLVLPLDSTALWRWALRKHTAARPGGCAALPASVGSGGRNSPPARAGT